MSFSVTPFGVVKAAAGSPKAKLKKLNDTDLAAYKQLVGKKPVSGFEDVDKDMRNWIKQTSKEARCWEGYEPVPGKKPYSKGSCRPKGTKKKTTEKKAENFNLGGVASGAGPQQMYHALNMLNQARVLVDPTETLKKHQLSRGDFESTIKQLADKPGASYDFDSMRRDPKRRAVLMGLLGSALGGAAGYSRSGIGGALGGAALGGLGGAGFGHVNATNYNRKLLGTAKVLKNYGLLQPEYLRAALPLLQKTSSTTKTAAVRKLQLLLTKQAVGPAAPATPTSPLLNKMRSQSQSSLARINPSLAQTKTDLQQKSQQLRANNLTNGTFMQGQLQPPAATVQKPGQSWTSPNANAFLKNRPAVKPPSGVPNKSYTSPSAADFLKKRGSEGGAWTRAEGKSESGGLNAKGRASLKAQGQDIKPPVTESNPTGERKDRKKSFCARMSGHKAKNTSAETARDPDSRINKALRKWRC